MMERYAINPATRKLHLQGCRYSRAAYETKEDVSLERLLENCGTSLSCCGHCLKANGNAQRAVEDHNGRLAGRRKKKGSEEKV